MNMNPQFFYLLNLVMITRLGFCFKDQPITLRRAVIMSFIQFLGLRQINDEKTCSTLTADCSLDTEGVLSVVRHPWYCAGRLWLQKRP